MYTDIIKQDTQILIPFISDKNSKDYQKYHTLSSGIVLSGKDIYSICSGTVVLVGKDINDLYTVIVQYNANQCFSYCLLKSTDLSLGDTIFKGMKIGESAKNMRFEYLSSAKGNSIWAVRIWDSTYYKQNPIKFVDGSIKTDQKTVIKSGFNTQTVFRSTP